MAAKIELTEGQSVGSAAGSDDLNQQLRTVVEQRIGLQPNPLEEDEPVERGALRPDIMSYPDHGASERKVIYDRLIAIESEVKKRGSRRPRGFRRYLVAMLIGVAATLAWQSYGESAKQIFVTRAPELGWSPEAKQMIAASVQWIGWTKPTASRERQAPPIAQTTPTTPSFDLGQVQQMTQNLAALRQAVELQAGGQDRMARDIARLEAAVAELIAKIQESPAQASVAPARKPVPVSPSSRTPMQPR
jgi:hypothetical protein